MTKAAVPSDSRYVPFVQQPYCCVPACIQTILYKNNLKLLSQEEIGIELGLVVPSDVAHTFFNVEVRDKPPIGSGFGTRIQLQEYSLQKLIEKQKWPFDFKPRLASGLGSTQELLQALAQAEDTNGDILICFQNDNKSGHVCVFDRILASKVRLIDPSQQFSKWRMMEAQELFERIQNHGDDNYGGLWRLDKQ